MLEIIDGRACARQLKELIVRELAELSNVDKPKLAIVQIADNPASEVYVRAKVKQAEEVGLAAYPLHFPESITQDHLLKLIDSLNADDEVHGMIVQLPLPKHLDPLAIVNRIRPDKDVDGLSVMNVGRLSMGLDCLVPCTPLGCLILLERLFDSLQGMHAVIVGRSNLVGKPLAQLLLQKNCTVTILHSKSNNPELITRQADILISAVGLPQFIKAGWIKPGAVVLDVGINRLENGMLVGDVDFDSAQPVAGYLSPVPGGVGPMTVACLLLNTVIAMAKQKGIVLKHLPLNPLREPLWP
jgi:methylenetetrahydrofolate dehydrogenase (NADP+) / methenyltetrahydrofolate cyclohydrolase